MEVNDEHLMNPDDILSAALSEAGLDEFFEPPSTSDDVTTTTIASTSDESPSTSTVTVVAPPDLSNAASTSTTIQPSELASPSTASTGSSPDLPVDGTSQATTPSTSSAVNDYKVASGTVTSSPGITARPTTMNSKIIVKPASQLLNAGASASTSSTTSLPGMAKFIKYINPEGKMYIVPMTASLNQKQIHSPNIRLIVARKQPQQIINAAKSSGVVNSVRHLIAPDMIPPTLDPILPILNRPGMVSAPTRIVNGGGGGVVGSLRTSTDFGTNAMRQQIPINRLMRPPPNMQPTFRHNNYARQRMIHNQHPVKRTVRFNPNVDVRDHHLPSPPPSIATTSQQRLAINPVRMSSSVISRQSRPTQPWGLNVANEVEVVATQNKPQNLFLPSISGTQIAAPLTMSNGDGSLTNGRQQQSSVRNAQKLDSKETAAKLDPLETEPSGAQVDDDEEEDWGHAETYSEYMPSKLRSGLSHPDPVVETSSLSSVMPPDVTYHFSIPEQIIDTGKLSALQLEAIIYACQQHEQSNPNGERVGYLIGDGAGVGKGRTVAGLIYENYLLGRKRALWFSVSSDLKYDAERDLADIGADRIKVHALNKFKYSKISGKDNGGVKKGVIFATYSSLIGESNNAKSKYRTRLKQVIHWCGGKNFDGVIVFDECHRAKNLVPTGSSKPTKTGQTVLELQKELPKARVIYASATGATETRNMAYMTRLGLWGPGKPFKDFNDFIMAVEKRGVGAMEIVAMDMKQRGLYLARQLSFAGTSFRIEEVPLSKEFIHVYDESVKLWLEARKQFQYASKLIDVERNDRKSMWGQFWAAHQRFFKYLCIAAKVNACVRMAREAVKNGKCVVIGLQSTGEARTLEQLDECGGELNDFVSTAKSVFMSLIEKHFPMSDGKKDSSRRTYSLKDAKNSLFTDAGDLFGDEKRRANKRKASDRQTASKRKKLEKDNTTKLSSDEETEDSSDAERSLDDDDERSSSTTSDDDHSTDSEEKSNNSDSSSGSDDDDDDDDDDEETEERFNPFADEEEEQDPWEIKLKKIQRKKSKKRRKQAKKDLEEVDELGKQLEEAMEEQEIQPKEVKQSQVNEVSVDVDEFLGSSSSFFGSGYERQDGFGDNFGLSQANMMKAELMAAVERLGDLLPPNTLDQLIDELGGPEYVAEMTGRKGRVVSREDGEIQYELRNEGDVPLELLNLAEKERFMNGQKHIAIISEAASSGISLQSDRRAKNQRRRVHITLELPWSADKAIQQFGRTHRSNQVNAPEYVFLISELAGEYRFASVVAKRLESLGALTHGDRRATESRDLSQFNLDTKYGRAALELTLKSILGYAAPVIKPPVGYKGDFYKDMRQYMEGVGLAFRESETSPYCLEKDVNISKFLNRILGLPVYAQNTLFQYFSDTLKAVVDEAKRDGRYDMGIMDLGSGREQVKKVETRVFIGKFDAGGFRTELHLVSIERGLSWDEASEIYSEHTRQDDGFYISLNSNIKTTAVLICAVGRRRLETNERLYNVFRPNTGLNPNMETLAELKQRYKKVLPDVAEPIWKEQYEISLNRCQHTFWYGKCRNELAGLTCEIGKRKRSYYILSGSVLSVWNTVENVLSGYGSGRRQARMQVVRVRTEQHQKIVGILIPNTFVRSVVERLTEESSRTYLELFNF